MRVAAIHFLFLAGLAIAPAYVRGQDDPNRPVLPDIAPRVVEIRGQLEISLPSLQRQPLMGFNPPPPVAPIPPDRRPFVEDYKQESLDLPPSPLMPPEPPAVASLISRAPRNGLMEGSIGLYFSRSIRFRSEWPISRPIAIYSRLDYKGSDGHEPEVNPAVTASFDALEALVGLQNVGRYAAFGAEVDGYLNSYRAFAASPASASLKNDPPLRDGRGGGVSVWMRTQATSYVDFNARLRYGTSVHKTDALDGRDIGLEELFEREERVLASTADLLIPIGSGRGITADVEFTGTGLDGDSAPGTIRTLDGAAGIRLSLARSLEIDASARFMTFAADPHRSIPGAQQVDGSGEETYVSPDLSLTMYPANGVRLYVKNSPRAEHLTLSSLYRMSPFVTDQAVIHPTVYTLDARGGAHLMRGLFEADLHAGYSRAPHFMFFERATTSEALGYSRGFVTTEYGEAAITYFGGDVSINLPAGFNASAGVTVRDGLLEESEDEIPYFGPIIGRGSLSYSFDGGRGFIQASTNYESARYVDRQRSRKIGDYFDLDLEMSYNFLTSLGAVIRLENISADYLERWEDYDQTPFVATAGVRVVW
ncbi:MAG: hypothetical protein WD275_00495 [Rhodothermales bacterium]